MTKFVVTVSVDAHVHYSAVVDADTADLAKEFARTHEGDLQWHDIGTAEYDDRDWDNIEPEEVDDDFVLDLPGLEPTPLHPACPKDPQPATEPSSPDDKRSSRSLMAIFCKLDTFIEL